VASLRLGPSEVVAKPIAGALCDRATSLMVGLLLWRFGGHGIPLVSGFVLYFASGGVATLFD
jgi:hypothetical protein